MSEQKKLPKLPPLPKEGGKRLKPLARGKTADLADLVKPAEPDEVIPAEDLYGIAMGGTEEGRWFETTVQDGTIGGRCAKCGRLRKAENLKLVTLPFGRGEQWECKEGDC